MSGTDFGSALQGGAASQGIISTTLRNQTHKATHYPLSHECVVVRIGLRSVGLPQRRWRLTPALPQPGVGWRERAEARRLSAHGSMPYITLHSHSEWSMSGADMALTAARCVEFLLTPR